MEKELKWGTIIPLIGGSAIGCKKSAGNENVVLSNAKTLAEDYAYYLNEIPGFLFELGGYNTNESREAPAHHTPDFFIDDSSLLLGVKVMTNLALDFLGSE